MLSLYKPLFEDMFASFDKMSRDMFDTSAWGIEQVKNEDNSLTINVDVPGVKEEDINVELSDNTLTIKAERKTAHATSSIQKSFSFPVGYDKNNIQASLKDGVLSLTLSCVSVPETKKISVKSGQ